MKAKGSQYYLNFKPLLAIVNNSGKGTFEKEDIIKLDFGCLESLVNYSLKL